MTGRAMAEGPVIPEFFARRGVLVTGATGFMGKVLVERLLATCPEVGALHLLVRRKGDSPPEKRLLDLKKSPVFDVVRRTSPEQLDKLRIVCGDITQPGLGLAPDALAQLQGVSVIFHCAATVKFMEPLRVAAEQNVLSVTRMLELADSLPDVAAFVHVSTAYCNPEQEHVEERVYPLPRPLPLMTEAALAVPDYADLDEVKRLIAPRPNTYTHTKAMGEAAVLLHEGRRYPAAIFRPSIVVNSLRHPFPGWIENQNGPCGLMLGVSAGLMRVVAARASARGDLLPVDLAIDTLIAVAWETAVDNSPLVRVYNCCTGRNPTTWGQMLRATLTHARANPMRDAFAYPTCCAQPNRFLYSVLVFVLQTAPLHLAHYLIRMFGVVKKNKMNLIRAARRMRTLNEAVRHFATHEYRFDDDRVRALRARLSPADQTIYNLDPGTINWEEFYGDMVRGCRVHLAKDRDENLPQSRKRLRKIFLIQRSVALLVPLLVARRVLRGLPAGAALARAAQLAAWLRAALARPLLSLAHLARALYAWVSGSGAAPIRLL